MTASKKSPYWSSLASSLTPYIPGEQPRKDKFIKLNTNENPYPPSPKAVEAINKTAGEVLRLYPDPSSTALREAVAERWGIKSEEVFIGNGSDEILAFAFAAFFEAQNNPAEPLLFPNITYSFYPVYAALWDLAFKTPVLNTDFAIDPNDYKQSSGGVIFPNPNAPTGRALDQKTIVDIAKAQEKVKKVLIVDEAYIAFSQGPGMGSMIPFIKENPNLLIVRTLSKEASLAGLRSAYACGSAELIEGLYRLKDSFNSYPLDRLAQAASIAAVLDTAYYEEINHRICQTRERVQAALNTLGFKVIPSQANFIFASPPGITDSGAAGFLAALREKGILVRHFKQSEIINYLRISIGTDVDMDTFLAACKEIIF